jgi:large subunit ribosomal protein L18
VDKARRQQRKRRIRAKISGTAARPRLAVTRTLSHIYAQLIDDENGVVLASANDVKTKKGTKTESAQNVGKEIAEKAKAAKISEVVFDRGGFIYHGRVKAVAEGAREGGLKF